MLLSASSGPRWLPGDDRADRGRVPPVRWFRWGRSPRRAGSGGLADVDRDQLLALFGLDEGGDRLPSEEKTPLVSEPSGSSVELAGLAGADPLHPEALVAPEEQRAAVGGDVFDVGRADAARPAASPSCRCAASCRRRRRRGALGALAAAEEDAAGEEARARTRRRRRSWSAGPGRARWAAPSRGRWTCRRRLGEAADEDDRLAVGREVGVVVVARAAGRAPCRPPPLSPTV